MVLFGKIKRIRRHQSPSGRYAATGILLACISMLAIAAFGWIRSTSAQQTVVELGPPKPIGSDMSTPTALDAPSISLLAPEPVRQHGPRTKLFQESRVSVPAVRDLAPPRLSLAADAQQKSTRPSVADLALPPEFQTNQSPREADATLADDLLLDEPLPDDSLLEGDSLIDGNRLNTSDALEGTNQSPAPDPLTTLEQIGSDDDLLASPGEQLDWQQDAQSLPAPNSETKNKTATQQEVIPAPQEAIPILPMEDSRGIQPGQHPSAVPSAPSPSDVVDPGQLTPLNRNALGSANGVSNAGPPFKAPEYQGPFFLQSDYQIAGPRVDVLAKQVPYDPNTFLPNPLSNAPTNPQIEASPYRGKYEVPTQRPLIELGRPLYTGGLYPPAYNWLGKYNPVMPHFMVYGDFRTGVGINRNAAGDTNNVAFRANLDMDLEITATERIHAFIGPLDRAGDFTRFEFTNDADFVDRTDMRLDNLFFEGDAGAILGGLTGQDALFDLPFAAGFLPVFYQNGIWAADNVIGAAVSIPSRHNRFLNWSNYDATFFWASDQINSDAFPGDANAAEFFGTAWFIEAYDGYVETNYAFVHDDTGGHRSYHNFSVAFTRRYFSRISNSIRFITNFNQSLPKDQRTAQGHLILIENSLISAAPNTFVPYFNFFYGQGRTQSLARAGVAGGILNNTGINFETDGLTGYPTLDATAVNTTGAALGLNMLGADFGHQLILEVAALAATGSAQFRNAAGDQYAVGMRYQKPLNNAWIFRTDHMYGFLRNAQDLRGSRIELRWKF